MNVLIFVEGDGWNIDRIIKKNVCKKTFSKVVIFFTSELERKKWESLYNTHSYTHLNINAQSGIFSDLIKKSYDITYKLIDLLLRSSLFENNERSLLKTLKPKIHRVVAELLKSERVVKTVIDYFKPEKVIVLKPKRESSPRIDSNVNLEVDCLVSYCTRLNIPLTRIVRRKLDFRFWIITQINIFKSLIQSPKIISSKISSDIKNQQVDCMYVFSHMYFRNQELYKILNNSDKKYVIITDWLSNQQIHEIEKNKNLSFIHFKGLLPYSLKQSARRTQHIHRILESEFESSELENTLMIVSQYFSNYIFHYFQPYLKNHRFFWNEISKLNIRKFIFTSYWEIQPALLINECKKNDINTLAIQAGIHPVGTKEDSVTDRYGVFGKWDYMGLLNAGVEKKKLFILGWPLGEYYKNSNLFSPLKISKPKEILFLLSMSGSWQHFFHFPEDEILLSIMNASRGFPDINFTIRTHSGNNVKKFQRLIKEEGASNLTISNTESLPEVLLNTDYVFTQSTTAGIEALYSGVPVFALNLFSDVKANPYSMLGERYSANNQSQLIELINSICTDPKIFLNTYVEDINEFINLVVEDKFYCEKILE